MYCAFILAAITPLRLERKGSVCLGDHFFTPCRLVSWYVSIFTEKADMEFGHGDMDERNHLCSEMRRLSMWMS